MAARPLNKSLHYLYYRTLTAMVKQKTSFWDQGASPASAMLREIWWDQERLHTEPNTLSARKHIA